jgi:hypothetical protein
MYEFQAGDILKYVDGTGSYLLGHESDGDVHKGDYFYVIGPGSSRDTVRVRHATLDCSRIAGGFGFYRACFRLVARCYPSDLASFIIEDLYYEQKK